MSREFDDLVDAENLEPEEELRLRSVHDMLLQAGPPPDLPPALESPAEPTDAEVAQFPLLPRRRWAVAAVLAAALAFAAFGGGYFYASKKHDKGFEAVHVVPLRGPGGALASIQMGERDSVGNWQMRFSVTGLKKQPNPREYYNLWLVKHGKPVVLCGSFRVRDKTTTVTFTVPYNAKRFEGWVVTVEKPPFKQHGPVVLST